ncbi:MAG TPA: glycosyl hydrolase 108 family protein [Pseudomonadales bacterium]|nr:glycosyl hydrolase 108 family protein [Pseudomonadales bacterium]
MKENFDSALKMILKSEGGFVNHKLDPGGMTNLGVTKKVWEAWVGKAVGESEMRALTPATVAPLYKRQYWDAVKADELPTGLDYLMFDFAINAGPGRAIKTMQKAIGTTPDGAIGPKTMAALKAADPTDLIAKFSVEKELFYKALPTFATFGRGWLRRVDEAKSHAVTMLA